MKMGRTARVERSPPPLAGSREIKTTDTDGGYFRGFWRLGPKWLAAKVNQPSIGITLPLLQIE